MLEKSPTVSAGGAVYVLKHREGYCELRSPGDCLIACLLRIMGFFSVTPSRVGWVAGVAGLLSSTAMMLEHGPDAEPPVGVILSLSC